MISKINRFCGNNFLICITVLIVGFGSGYFVYKKIEKLRKKSAYES